MIEVKRREGENSNSLYFRFSKRMRQSGVIAEVRRRRFRARAPNKRKVRLSAKYRHAQTAEIQQKRKLGITS